MARHHDIHSSLITGNTQQLESAAQVYEGPQPEAGLDLKDLHAKIGQPSLERDFLEGTLTKVGGVSARHCFSMQEIFDTDRGGQFSSTTLQRRSTDPASESA